MKISNASRVVGFGLLALVIHTGCETMPREIDGRPVVGVRVVDGQRVYLVQSQTGDVIETHARAAESKDAARDITFSGTR